MRYRDNMTESEVEQFIAEINALDAAYADAFKPETCRYCGKDCTSSGTPCDDFVNDPNGLYDSESEWDFYQRIGR
jgi:hypothetical protein